MRLRGLERNWNSLARVAGSSSSGFTLAGHL